MEGDLVAISVSGGDLIGYAGSCVDYKRFALERVRELNRGSNTGVVGDASKPKANRIFNDKFLNTSGFLSLFCGNLHSL
jgi:hypothetical protein